LKILKIVGIAVLVGAILFDGTPISTMIFGGGEKVSVLLEN